MPGRTIAFGDVHGCLQALVALLEWIDPQPDDTLVPLGDYIDRGPDSRGVLELLIKLPERCQVVPLMGNHEKMMLRAIARHFDRGFWLEHGGKEALASYGPSATIDDIDPEHIEYIENLNLYWQTPTHIFVHAMYEPNERLERQLEGALLWKSLHNTTPGPHYSGKTAVVGHSAQKDGEVLDLGYLKCIDTYCHGGGWLTAMDVGTGRIWQVDRDGARRET